MSLLPGNLPETSGQGNAILPTNQGEGVGFRPGKCRWENAAMFAYIWCVQRIPEKEQMVAVAVILEDSLFKLLMDLLIQYGVSLRTHLHFLGSMQNEPQVIKFSLSPWGSCKWPALAIIQFGHLVSHQADGLCHQAVFRNLDAPSFWLCNQCKIYFWPLKSKFSQTSTLFPRYHTLRLLMVLVQITGTQKCAVRLLIRAWSTIWTSLNHSVWFY